MKITEHRTMIYLPNSLYKNTRQKAQEERKSFSAIVREALEQFVNVSEKEQRQKSLEAGFGLWNDMKEDSVSYVRRIRRGWNRKYIKKI